MGTDNSTHPETSIVKDIKAQKSPNCYFYHDLTLELIAQACTYIDQAQLQAGPSLATALITRIKLIISSCYYCWFLPQMIIVRCLQGSLTGIQALTTSLHLLLIRGYICIQLVGLYFLSQGYRSGEYITIQTPTPLTYGYCWKLIQEKYTTIV